MIVEQMIELMYSRLKPNGRISWLVNLSVLSHQRIDLKVGTMPDMEKKFHLLLNQNLGGGGGG
jgi:hypothetical protein